MILASVGLGPGGVAAASPKRPSRKPSQNTTETPNRRSCPGGRALGHRQQRRDRDFSTGGRARDCRPRRQSGRSRCYRHRPPPPTIRAPGPAITIHRQSPPARPKRPTRNRVCCCLPQSPPSTWRDTRHCSAQAQYIAFPSPLQPLIVGTGGRLGPGTSRPRRRRDPRPGAGSLAMRPRHPCRRQARTGRQAERRRVTPETARTTSIRLRATYWTQKLTGATIRSVPVVECDPGVSTPEQRTQ